MTTKTRDAILPIVASVLVSAAGAAWIAGSQIGELRTRVKVLETKVEALDADRLIAIAENVLDAFPPGTVLVSHKGLNPTLEYGDNWVRCGDAPETPLLDGLFLVGATQQDVGDEIGSVEHDHEFSGRTGDEADGRRSSREGADNYTGDPNWQHKHDYRGMSAAVNHVPPARKVLFLCKVS